MKTCKNYVKKRPNIRLFYSIIKNDRKYSQMKERERERERETCAGTPSDIRGFFSLTVEIVPRVSPLAGPEPTNDMLRGR